MTDHIEGGRDEQEAIYDGANYRVTSGGRCKGFSRQERRADMPGDRDNRTDLLSMAQRIRGHEDRPGKASQGTGEGELASQESGSGADIGQTDFEGGA